jgi:hypothetical protein
MLGLMDCSSVTSSPSCALDPLDAAHKVHGGRALGSMRVDELQFLAKTLHVRSGGKKGDLIARVRFVHENVCVFSCLASVCDSPYGTTMV